MRRTGTTLTGMFGVRPEVIEKCLNHLQQNRRIRAYQRQGLTAEQKDAALALSQFPPNYRSFTNSSVGNAPPSTGMLMSTTARTCSCSDLVKSKATGHCLAPDEAGTRQ